MLRRTALAGLAVAVLAVSGLPVLAAMRNGTPHGDTLIGTPKHDVLRGRGGNDTIDGRGGADVLDGGAGNDRIEADGRDRVIGGKGNDRILVVAQVVRFKVDCGPGRDRVTVTAPKRIAARTLRARTPHCEVRRMVVDPHVGRPGGPAPVLPTPPATGPELPPASVFVAPTGSDDADCAQASPCQSFTRAYKVARPGEVVEVAAGDYPEQLLERDDSKTSDSDVVFRPAPGATVSTGQLTFGRDTDDLGALHVEVRDMRVNGISERRSEDLTFRRLTMVGGFSFEGGRGIRILGGSVGPEKGSNPVISTWFNQNGQSQVPTDILIDSVEFHDIRMGQASDHIECLHINDADGLTIRNSIFHRCDTFDLNVMYGHDNVLRRLLIENNIFAPTDDSFGGETYYGLSLRGGEDVIIRNNTSTQAWAGPAEADDVSNWLVANNIFPSPSCDSRITYRNNLWIGKGRCVASDRAVPDPLLDASFHLTAGSRAIDAAAPGDAPATDIDGQARPRGNAPDIGADEF